MKRLFNLKLRMAALAAICFGCALCAEENLLTVTVPENMTLPVIIQGKALLKNTRGKTRRDSVTVKTENGKIIPFQIDCRDADGNYVKRTDPYLASEDEIVFVSVPEDGNTYKILCNSKNQPQKFPNLITAEIPESLTDLALTNSDQLYIGIKASGARPNEKKILFKETEANDAENVGVNAVPLEHLLLERRKKQFAPSRSAMSDYSKGGMTITFKNRKMTDSGSWENMTLPVQPFGRNWDSAAWSLPEIIVSGPVRKIIRICHEENIKTDIIKNGLYLRKGIRGKTKTEHLFSIYSKGGTIDFAETVTYEQADLGLLLAYSFPVRNGNTPAGDLLLLTPDDISDGKIRADLQKEFLPENLPENSFYNLYVNPVHRKQLPGYFGFMDKKSKTVFAIFYDPVMNSKETSNLTIQGNVKNIRRGAPSGCQAILAKTVFIGKAKSGKPGTYKIKFRFFIDASGNPETVKSAYAFWKDSMEK